jgi:uncharacterized protein (DUF1499 family)
MNPVAWLIGLVLPACALPGAAGLPTPPPTDVAHIVRPASPNTALAAPNGFSPPPDIVTPRYHLPADQLFAAIREVATDQPRTFPAALYADRLQVHYVARSAVFNFPDEIMVQVRQDGPDNSALIMYSRSVYGHSDLGANRKRIEAWLADLRTKTSATSNK